MGYFRDSHRIVVKVGTSTLTHATGHLNLRRIESLVRVLSDIKNSGVQVVLVSSGAVSTGVAKVGFGKIPASPEEKQAMSAIGQSELMKLYDNLFSNYGQKKPLNRRKTVNHFTKLSQLTHYDPSTKLCFFTYFSQKPVFLCKKC